MAEQSPTTLALVPQPIETAPRDGTYILAWSWLSESWQPVTWSNGRWITTWDHDDFPRAEFWVPMPAVPDLVPED